MKNSMMLSSAIELAAIAHHGQVDLNGQPYILHPLRVMMKMKGSYLKTIAVLHDVVEDTPVTLDDIMGRFPLTVYNEIDTLTRRDGESWSNYLNRFSRNSLAIKVKIEDLKDNLDILRFSEKLTKKDLNRIKQYHDGLLKLQEA